MISFRILHIDLSRQQHNVYTLDNHQHLIGGSPLAHFLHSQYYQSNKAWDAPEQPIVFAIGPLTGFFPLMSKMVSAFTSPNTSYTESYAGGRAGLALKFTAFDAIVLTGQNEKLSCLELTSDGPNIKDMVFAKDLEPSVSISFARKMFPKGAGQRTIMSIGSSGERGSPLAAINVDTHRHFGRMGGGAILGQKNIKVLIIHGNQALPLPGGTRYNQLYQEIFSDIAQTQNITEKDPLHSPLAGIVATEDLHGGACASCPIGCVHPGFIRRKLERSHKKDIELGDEPIFWLGKILQIKASFDILRLLEANERYSFDVLGVAVALYWATMATEQGYISTDETIYPLAFGNAKAYQQAISALAKGANGFYRNLAEGSEKIALRYGAKEHACTLGEEKTFLSTIIFRSPTQDFHWTPQDVHNIVQKAISRQRDKEHLNSMITCLFGRKLYQGGTIAQCLLASGYPQSFVNGVKDIHRDAWHNGRRETLPLSKKFYTSILPKAVNPQGFLLALQREYEKQMRTLYPGKDEL